jgi:hypothetical protein
MDPDMVRQQEEAEEEARRLKRSVATPKVTAPVLAEPDPTEEAEEYVGPLQPEPETETVLIHSHAPGLPPVLPIRRRRRKPAVEARERVGWLAAMRVSLYGLIMAGLGLLGGIMIGVKLGWSPAQSLGTGAGLGFVLAWQSAFVSLRANRDVSFLRAILLGVCPALILILTLIVAMVAGSHITGIKPDAISNVQLRDFWMIVASGGAVGLLLSTLQTRKLTLR